MPAGRPTDYHNDLLPKVKKLANAGLTDEQLAAALDVCTATIYNWKRDHPEFLEALTISKAASNGKVRRSLFERACGYYHPEVHISSYEGDITETEIVKHYPPDTAACAIWLKNRGSNDPETGGQEIWRDKQEITHLGLPTPPTTLDVRIIDAAN